MTLTITRTGTSAVTKTVTVVPGTLKCQDITVDAGGEQLPLIRTNCGLSGSCKVLLDSSTFTYSDALALLSGAGEGNFTISAPVSCSDALIDINFAGAGAQVVEISWKGIASAASSASSSNSSTSNE